MTGKNNDYDGKSMCRKLQQGSLRRQCQAVGGIHCRRPRGTSKLKVLCHSLAGVQQPQTQSSQVKAVPSRKVISLPVDRSNIRNARFLAMSRHSAKRYHGMCDLL